MRCSAPAPEGRTDWPGPAWLPLPRCRRRWPVVFGLVVWAATFQGALPALGVMRRTTQHGLERWPAPLMGHSLFGLVTAVVSEEVQQLLTR